MSDAGYYDIPPIERADLPPNPDGLLTTDPDMPRLLALTFESIAVTSSETRAAAVQGVYERRYAEAQQREETETDDR